MLPELEALILGGGLQEDGCHGGALHFPILQRVCEEVILVLVQSGIAISLSISHESYVHQLIQAMSIKLRFKYFIIN